MLYVNYKQSVCATLQMLFVVCVNLQGLFIFFFHCVRNPAVRSEWKTVLSRTVISYSGEAAGSARCSVPLQPMNRETTDLRSDDNVTL